MGILSESDLKFFEENGYVVACGAVSAEQAAATAQEVWEFSGKDPADPESWYGVHMRAGKEYGTRGAPGIMVEMYHGPRQWENRTAPGVHEAFSQIWGTRKLWCSMDRVSINPPCRDDEILQDPQLEARGVHWDNAQLRLAKSAADVGPLKFGVQGVLYLVDTLPENGAFVCVPGFHRVIDEWLQALPPGAQPAQQDYLAMRGAEDKGLTRIGAKAGDLVIWQTTLPHYSAVNIGTAPRVAQCERDPALAPSRARAGACPAGRN